MIFWKSIPVLLAGAAAAVRGLVAEDAHLADAAARDELHARGILQTIVYKRGDVLTPRDLELAEMHNIDLQEMWKHSIVKRADGDDWTIWVHNSFVDADPDPVEAPKLSSRQKPQGVQVYGYWGPFGTTPHCLDETYNDDTGPTAPYTDGVKTMRDWLRNKRVGSFNFNHPTTASGVWLSMVYAGSNSGGNAIFQASPPMRMRGTSAKTIITVWDAARLVQTAEERYARRIGSSWRVRVWGHMWCDPYMYGGDDNILDLRTYWRITNTPLQIDFKGASGG